MDKPNKYYQNAAAIWFEKAQDDLAWTENNIKTGFYTQACFTAQQAAEKSLKAFLRRSKKEIDEKFKTHDLINLLNQCSRLDKDFAGLEESCRILTEYYAPTRYPEILGLEFRGYGKEQAEEALGLAKAVGEFTKKKLKER